MDKNIHILIPKETSENLEKINKKLKAGDKIVCIGRNSLGIIVHFEEKPKK